MKFYSIASGSSGNCIYVASERTRLLVDVGISKKRIEETLSMIEVSPQSLDGIFITHEHSDHIKGLGVMMRKYRLPVFATPGTIEQILKCRSLGEIDSELLQPITRDEQVIVGDISVLPVRTSHDAAEPVAYRFTCEGKRVAVLTDLGTYDEHIVATMQNLDGILIEANHDVRMLQVGSYPYYLKQRILGDQGHLSNEVSGQLLCELIHDNMKMIMLGHLSQENNLEELAFETIRQEIECSAREHGCRELCIDVAKRNDPSRLYEF